MKKWFITIVALLLFGQLFAQELNCTVQINTEQIDGSNKQQFETLRQSIEDFINTNKWTNLTFAEQEKIECKMLLVCKQVTVDNHYTCELTLQASRPVYNTTYSTTLLNLKDASFNFAYQEYDQLTYQQNDFRSNLTAMLAYYVYLILGYDADSFQKLGGTPFFQQCENIVSTCQSASMASDEQKGWLAFDSNKNRYALVNNLLDEAFKPLRNYFYEYHRLGLDEMTNNVDNARARIASGLSVLKDANRARPSTYMCGVFLDAKADEICQLFHGGTDKEKDDIYKLLMDIDPTRSNTYDQIKE